MVAPKVIFTDTWFRKAAAPIGLALLVVPAQASAANSPIILPPLAMISASQPCVQPSPSFVAQAAPMGALAPAASKAGALVGAPMSALEAMRLQQASAGSPSLIQTALAPVALRATAPLEPAAPAVRIAAQHCQSSWSSVARPTSLAAVRSTTGGSDFLQSRRVAIGRTYFDAEWQRVKRDRVAPGRELRRLTSVGAREDRLATVNAWVNNRIAYVEDRDLFRKADHWAGARVTMRLGKGDCEDIALLKMNLLSALGIPREDMILTIARDLVRRTDHAVLIVKDGDRFVMLDNATDTVLDASLSYDYQPVLSFGDRQSWLHGY